jgi:hypothetical protein
VSSVSSIFRCRHLVKVPARHQFRAKMTRDAPLFDWPLRRRSLDDQLGTSDAGDRLPWLSFGVFRTSNLATTIPGLEARCVITIKQTAAGYQAMRLGDRLMPPSTNCVARTGLNTAKNFWQTWLCGLPDLASVGLKIASYVAIGGFIRPILRFGSQ